MNIPSVISVPDREPVTLDEQKAHSRVDYDGDDALISALLLASRQRCEGMLGRKLITQTVRWQPRAVRGVLALPYPNVQSVSLSYYDTAGALTTISPATYRVLNYADSGNDCFVELLDYQSWPTVDDRLQPWRIDFVCGYGDTGDSVPEEIRLGIKILAAQWYENREAGVTGTIYTDLPFTVHALWSAHQWRPVT
jgi:uncharacterized phiE125 gp8 family phage protein